MLKKLTPYFQGYGKYLILGPLCVLLEVVAELLVPLLMAEIVDVGIANLDTVYIGQVGGIMIALALGAIFFGCANMIFSSRAAMGFSAGLRNDMFQRIQNFSFANIDHFSTASLVTRLTNDVNQLQTTVLMGLRILVRAPLTLICALVLAIRINLELAGILLVVAPLLIITVVVIMRMVQPRFKIMQQRLDDVNSVVQEDLIAIRVVKAFVREGKEKEKFAKVNDAYLKAGLSATFVVISIMPIMMILLNGSMIASIWYGGQMVGNGVLGTGLLITFITYIMQILGSLLMVAMVLLMASRARASATRIFEVLDTEPTIQDSPEAQPTQQQAGRGRVEYRQVDFKFNPEQEENVLADINFTAEPGQMIAIVGGTGDGKSSLVQLLPRLYDVAEGAVLLDGRDVRDWPLTELRQNVAMVLQNSRLFSGSIKENLRWGNPEATDEEIARAARIAQAEEFILSLPDGFDTELGQGGVNLSGGQKQRLCIARAVLKRPSVLILDDSTSAVDSDTEAKLRRAFYEEMPETTILMIAQRISSVAEADQILVLQHGRLVGCGKHAELLAQNEVYQDIYHSQQNVGEVG